jgi:DNA-directed RNA polymerase subunit omega
MIKPVANGNCNTGAEWRGFIGLTGFEPATFRTRGERSTKLSHSPNCASRENSSGARTISLIFLLLASRSARPSDDIPALTNRLTARARARKVKTLFCPTMLASNLIPPVISGGTPTILQFSAEATRSVRSLRNMTTQLLQEAAQVIPNQQLLINVVSRRVRQLGLGHRPLVEATPRSSLTDIALREIIAGKLTYELTPEKPADGAAS